MNLYPEIAGLAETLNAEADSIDESRKLELEVLSRAILDSLHQLGHADLVVICTHNSRRSQLGQVWIKAAAAYYGIPAVRTYSGGTEATAFHHNMAQAMRDSGFMVNRLDDSENPKYYIPLSDEDLGLDILYSKKFDESYNPKKDFIAVMVCSQADEACPFVEGAFRRVSLPFDDPKKADGTANEQAAYINKVREMGREFLYVMRLVRQDAEAG